MSLRKIIGIGLMLIAVILISMNFAAIIISPARSPYANKIPRAKTTLAELNHVKITTHYEDFAKKITHLFFTGIRSHWYTADLHLPFWKNWLLFAMPYFVPPISHTLSTVRKKLFLVTDYYEYSNYNDAVNRGVGLCSQHALATASFLKHLGFHSAAMALNGHVVDETTFPNKKTYILDSDEDVFMPFGLAYAKSHPNTVKMYYKKAGFPASLFSNIDQIYTHPSYPYAEKLSWVVHTTEVLDWILPVLILLIGAIL